MGRTRKLILLALCVLLATAGGATLAAFSAQTSNSGNNFSAAASFPGQLRMASGTYDGNGNDNRSISGVGFQPDVVIIKGNNSVEATMGTNTMTGDASKRLVGGNSLDSNRIQAIEADGFQLGNHNSVNGSGVTYYWTAFKAADGVLKVGSFTGNGGTQSITDVGFSPEYIVTASSGGERAVQWFSPSANTYRFDADTGNSAGVTGTGPDGFTVGNYNSTNGSGRTIHYVAFNQVGNSVKVGTYTGNGGTRSVTGVGFAPEYVMVRSTTSQTGQHRNAMLPGTESQYFQNNTNLTNAITALGSDGFTLGNSTIVNTNGTTYQYVAFNNGAGGCARPQSGLIIGASADSWVDQANASANNGTAPTLRVTSQAGGQNQRTFVKVDLPSVPTGCVPTSATLFLYHSTPVAGRTLAVHRAAAAWNENTITWANQPATAGTAATTVTNGFTGYMSWNVTSLVADQYTSGNFGFRVADQSEGDASGVTQVFSSREGTNSPGMLLSIGS